MQLTTEYDGKQYGIRKVLGESGDSYHVYDADDNPVAYIYDGDDGYTYVAKGDATGFRRFDSSGAQTVSEVVKRGLATLFE